MLSGAPVLLWRRSPRTHSVLAAALAASVALHTALALLPVAPGGIAARVGSASLVATLSAADPAVDSGRQRQSAPPAMEPAQPRAKSPRGTGRAPPRARNEPTGIVRAGTLMDPSPFGLGSQQSFAGRTYHHYGSAALREPPDLPDLRVRWPRDLLAQGAEGLVLVRALVARDGSLDGAQTLCRDMRFESEVNAALATARFSPGDGPDGPQPVAMLVEFVFLQPQPDADRRAIARRIDQLRDACHQKAREILAASESV